MGPKKRPIANYRRSTNINIFDECQIVTKSTQTRVGRGVVIPSTTDLRGNGRPDLFHGSKFQMVTYKGFATLTPLMFNTKTEDAKLLVRVKQSHQRIKAV